MPPAADRKVWNEDLVNACQSRYEMAVRSGDRRQFMWREGAEKIKAIRKDIYTFSTGRIANFPPQNLKKTVLNLCLDIINGKKEVVPRGYAEMMQRSQGNAYVEHPYLKQIKARGGAYAILMAFHHSATKTLSIDEICSKAQPYCDTEMRENFHAGRMHGAWKNNKTLRNHGLIVQTAGGAQYVNGVGFRGQKHYYTLTSDGEKFIEALLRKFPQGAASLHANARPSTSTFGSAKSPLRTPPHTTRPSSVKATHTNKLAEGDGEKLLDWILSGAQVDDTMSFKVGKARRKQLHDACDALEREFPGLHLNHSSTYETDTSNRRVLTVRVLQLPSSHGSELPGSAKRRLFGGSFAAAPAASDTLDLVTSPSPTKRPRSNLPAPVAAAQAALARQAMFESRMESERKDSAVDADGDGYDDAQLKLALELSRQKSPTVSTRERQEPIESILMGTGDFDEDMKVALMLSQETASKPTKSTELEELDQKPAAREDVDLEEDENLKLAMELSRQSAPNYSKTSPFLAQRPAGKYNPEPYSSDSDDDLLSYTPTFGHSGQASTSTNAVSEKRDPPVKRSLFGSKMEEECIDLLSDDDESPPIVARKKAPTDKMLPMKAKTIGTRKRLPTATKEVIDIYAGSDEDDEVIELLDDSQDNIFPFGVTSNRDPIQSALAHQQLTILIDDRERNRNVTPRHLRMELTRLVMDGDIKSIWPRVMPTGHVEERALVLGDFAFDVEHCSQGRKRISIAVERKRVSDLVQRSASGDHWRQFARMRDICTHSIFLIETDTRAAARFTAFGSQELEEWNPAGTLIDDERSIFLFFGRALLSSRSANFIQTRDEISSLRAVAALGVMAVASDKLRRKAAKAATPTSNADNRLVDRLTAGGIPWKLARMMGDSLGSIQHLEHLYADCASDECRSALLAPFITETEFEGKEKAAAEWSSSICRVMHASCTASPSTGSEKRHVTIELSEAESNLIETPTEKSFYSFKVRERNPLNLVLPTVVMRTSAGNLVSHRLFVHLLQAKAMISLITDRIKDCAGDFVALAREVATVINSQCHHRTMSRGKDRRVLILCGLNPALDAAAKKAGYASETRVLADLVLAQLMLEHDLIVIQAVRLKGDTELILQQLSLACFHYHLLFQECDGR